MRGKNDDHGYFHNCHDNDFRQKFQSSVSVIGRLTIASNPTDIPGVICFSSRNIEPEQKMKKSKNKQRTFPPRNWIKKVIDLCFFCEYWSDLSLLKFEYWSDLFYLQTAQLPGVCLHLLWAGWPIKKITRRRRMFVVLVYLQLFSTELSSCLKHFHHIISNSFFCDIFCCQKISPIFRAVEYPPKNCNCQPCMKIDGYASVLLK